MVEKVSKKKDLGHAAGEQADPFIEALVDGSGANGKAGDRALADSAQDALDNPLFEDAADDEMEDEESEGIPYSDPVEAAEAAGLYYVMDGEPGYTRVKEGDHFVYLNTQRKPLKNPRQIERAKSLVIPPAWTDVWICCRTNGHIQATGRDTKGRKQYRYHDEWARIRSLNKFGRIVLFGESLPAIRARVAEDLRGTKLSHEKVTALVVRLMEQTLIRVGNQEYARKNNSYGLTTLLDDHITVNGSRISMKFIGKRGKAFEVDLHNRALARLVKRCQDLPGQRLFQYLDENGECCHAVTSGDVNTYLRETTGQEFSAKDFRTWGGTVIAALELYSFGPAESEKEAEKHIVQVVKTVAEALGNTPTICRKYYIYPGVLDAYRDGSLFETMTAMLQAHEPHPVEETQAVPASAPVNEAGLSVEEQAVLSLLRRQAEASDQN